MHPICPRLIVSGESILPQVNCTGMCPFVPQSLVLGVSIFTPRLSSGPGEWRNVMVEKYFVGLINLALYFFAEVDMDGL